MKGQTASWRSIEIQSGLRVAGAITIIWGERNIMFKGYPHYQVSMQITCRVVHNKDRGQKMGSPKKEWPPQGFPMSRWTRERAKETLPHSPACISFLFFLLFLILPFFYRGMLYRPPEETGTSILMFFPFSCNFFLFFTFQVLMSVSHRQPRHY
jgi:hypothetical protein